VNEQSNYEMLGVDMFASSSEIQAAVERLSRQANAIANTDPERSRVIREQIRRIKEELLSGEERRNAYNRRLVAAGKADLTPNAPSSAWESEFDGRQRGQGGGRGGGNRPGMPVALGQPGRRGLRRYWVVAVAILVVIAAAVGAVAASTLAHVNVAVSTATALTTPTSVLLPTLAPTTRAQPSRTAAAEQISLPTVSVSATPPAPAGGSNVLYEARFDRGMPGWLANSNGAWQTTGGQMTYSGTGKGAILAPFAMVPSQRYAVEASIESGPCTRSAHGFGIYVRASEDVNDSSGVFGGLWSSGALIWTAQHGDYVRVPFDAGRHWWTVRVEVEGNRIRMLVDGALLTEALVPQFQTLPRVGVGASYCAVRVRAFRIVALSEG
jgi:hypothetical protein